MRGKLSILFVLLTFVCAGALFTLPQTVTAETRDYQVTSDYDSAEEKVYPGDLTHGYMKRSSDLDLGNNNNGPDYYIVGIRFLNVDVPQGATITNAYITFYPDDDQDDPCNLIIYGQDSDDTVSFSSDDFDISTRPMTDESVTWSPDVWTSSDVSNHTPKPTPNIKTIVQEIVNRGGWSSGNSMVFIIDDNGSVRSRPKTLIPTRPMHPSYTSSLP